MLDDDPSGLTWQVLPRSPAPKAESPEAAEIYPPGTFGSVPAAAWAAPTPEPAPEPLVVARVPGSGPGWNVREQQPKRPEWAPSSAPTPDAAPYGAPAPGGLQAGYQPFQIPVPAPRRGGGRRAAGGAASILAVLLIFIIKVGIVTLGARGIAAVTSKTYHAPPAIGAATQTTDARIVASLATLKNAYVLPVLQGAHSEAQAYVIHGAVAYLLAFGQDNSGHDNQRQGGGLTDAFPDVTASTVINSRSAGFTIQCGTVADSQGPYQACTWYDPQAFGAFADYASPSPGAAAAVLGPALGSMSG